MDNENQDVEVEKANEEVENQDNAGKVEEDKAAKTVEKLQKRLGKVTCSSEKSGRGWQAGLCCLSIQGEGS